MIIIKIKTEISKKCYCSTGYSAPMRVYNELSSDIVASAAQPMRNINLCVGKEWYRFSSSFFLPNHLMESRYISNHACISIQS